MRMVEERENGESFYESFFYLLSRFVNQFKEF